MMGLFLYGSALLPRINVISVLSDCVTFWLFWFGSECSISSPPFYHVSTFGQLRKKNAWCLVLEIPILWQNHLHCLIEAGWVNTNASVNVVKGTGRFLSFCCFDKQYIDKHMSSFHESQKGRHNYCKHMVPFWGQWLWLFNNRALCK